MHPICSCYDNDFLLPHTSEFKVIFQKEEMNLLATEINLTYIFLFHTKGMK